MKNLIQTYSTIILVLQFQQGVGVGGVNLNELTLVFFLHVLTIKSQYYIT